MPTNTAPQSVSSRYSHNLLCRGKNSTFELEQVVQQIASTPGGLPCGFYYNAIVKRTVDFKLFDGEGMTPVAAVTRALEKHGVTFR